MQLQIKLVDATQPINYGHYDKQYLKGDIKKNSTDLMGDQLAVLFTYFHGRESLNKARKSIFL